ncbi:MAG: histidinol-phosphatase HisJ family protein [Oscillospiraceae bacterium]|nr:histidinol-phosphatase HisJ family protein [Oscillospiraceae bacterium]
MIRQNLHCHTDFDDGADSPEAMILAAEKAGLSSVGVSLHCPIPGEDDWCCPAENEPQFLETMHGLRAKYRGRIEVFCGLEYDTRAARRSVPPYDYIIGSCHFLGGHAVDNTPAEAEAVIAQFSSPDRAAEAYFAQLAALAAFDEIAVVGHFDLLTKYEERGPLYDPSSPAYRDAAFAAMETLNRAGKIFEINTGAISRGWRTTPYPSPELLRHLHSLGGRICICSDAHAADGIVCAFDAAEALARSCGFTEYQVFDGQGFVSAAF